MEKEGQATRSSTTATGDSPPGVVDPAEPEDGARPDAPEVEVIERESPLRSALAEIVPEVVLLGVAVYAFYLAGDFGGQTDPGQLGPGFWPRMAASGLAIALVARIIQVIRARNRPIVKVRSEFDWEDEAPIYWKQVGIAMALAVAYVYATMFIGFLFGTAVFLTVFIWAGGQRRWFVPLVGAAGALVAAWVFIGLVYVALPTGVGIFDTLTVEIYNALGIQ